MNDRAREILEFVQRRKRDAGIPPTIREIGIEFGIASTNGVRYYLTLLEKAGHLTRQKRISRGIATAEVSRSNEIPILGRVAAGQPTLAETSYEGSLDPSRVFGESRDLFALRIKGDSMIEAGILENDYVVVRKQETANTGEIVVALIEEDEATVKYYQPRKDRIELVAANPKYKPIVVPRDVPFQILGVVRGVIRTVGR